MVDAKKAIIIIPTYNEKENVERLVEDIFKHQPDINILFVDDNSPDGTADIIKSLMNKYKSVSILQREGKMGLGSAYIAGFRFALENGYEYIIEMDADFSHNPKEIPNFLEAIETSDLVIGSRYIKGVNVVNWPLNRLLISYFANVYTRIVTGLSVRDLTGGYKCFRRKVLETIDLSSIKSNGYAFQIELNFKTWAHGFKIKEISIIFVDRVYGESKLSKEIMWEAFFLVWRLKINYMLGKK